MLRVDRAVDWQVTVLSEACLATQEPESAASGYVGEATTSEAEYASLMPDFLVCKSQVHVHAQRLSQFLSVKALVAGTDITHLARPGCPCQVLEARMGNMH